MAEAQIMSLTPEQLGAIMQDAGYRTEYRTDNNGTPLIASATGGISFNVRLGNRAVPPAEGYLDFTYLTVIKIEGEFPVDRANDWNRNKRFARLHKVDDFVVFDMDVVVAAGVTHNHIRATMELWDRLLQELMGWLRGDTAPGAVANSA